MVITDALAARPKPVRTATNCTRLVTPGPPGTELRNLLQEKPEKDSADPCQHHDARRRRPTDKMDSPPKGRTD
jgi:hypothetical protein